MRNGKKNSTYGTKEWFENKFSSTSGIDNRGASFRASLLMRFEWMENLLTKEIHHSYVETLCDIGCAGCEFTQRLSKLFPKATIYACDISEKAICANIKNFPNYCFSNDCLPDLNYSNEQFEFVATTEVLYYMRGPDREKAMNNIARIIKPGGYFLFTSNLDDGQRYFREQEILKLFSKYFSILKVSYQYSKIYRIIETPLWGIILLRNVYLSGNINDIDFLSNRYLAKKVLKEVPWSSISKVLVLLFFPLAFNIITNKSLVKLSAWATKKLLGTKGKTNILILGKKE